MDALVGLQFHTGEYAISNVSFEGNTVANVVWEGLNAGTVTGSSYTGNTFRDIWSSAVHFFGNGNTISQNNFIHCDPPLENWPDDNLWYESEQGNYYEDYLDHYPGAKARTDLPGVWNIPYGFQSLHDRLGPPVSYDPFPLMDRIYSDTTVNVPDIPTLLAPAKHEALESDTVSFRWIPAERATSYRLQVSMDTTFEDPILNDGKIADTTFNLSGLAGHTTYYWRVLANNSGIISRWSDVWQFSIGTPTSIEESVQNDLPESYVLYQNFPNPFSQTTMIQFDVPESNFIELGVCNILGQEVEKLVVGMYSPGTYSVEWNASDFSSGIYFCHLKTGRSIMVKRLLLLK
jgi:hypothetical protein